MVQYIVMTNAIQERCLFSISIFFAAGLILFGFYLSPANAVPKAGEFTRRYRETAIKYPYLFASEVDDQIKSGRLTPSNDPLSQNNLSIVMCLLDKLRVDNTVESLRLNNNLREFFGWMISEFSITFGESIFDRKTTDKYQLARNEKTTNGRYYLRDVILWCLYPSTAIKGERNYGVTPFVSESKLVNDLAKWKGKYPEVIGAVNDKSSRDEIATVIAQLTFWDIGQDIIASDPTFRLWLKQYWIDYGWTISQIGAIKLIPIDKIKKGTDQQQISQRKQISNALRLFLTGAGIAR